MRHTIYNYSKDNVLLIPQSLHGMADARALLCAGNAGIFYKRIDADLTNVEFHTDCPCLVFIASGVENFTPSSGGELTIHKNEMIFLPKNEYFISDFIKQDAALRAYLFFFDQHIIDKFISTHNTPAKTASKRPLPYIFKPSNAVLAYISALRPVYEQTRSSTSLVQTKLLELLYLLSAEDKTMKLSTALRQTPPPTNKRNIMHIMKAHAQSKLTLDDFARLSGRSRSAFNREFKLLHGTSPHQWLTKTRLGHARDLLLSTQQSVTDIAYLSGYDSPSHFINLYGKEFGETPSKTRQMI